MILLDLLGGVALLLWGLHMVHSGILRAFGPDLRLLLAGALKNRFAAFMAGLGLTALLQSSTATALITSSFTAEGLVSLVPALAIMLGANVGTTLIVQVLSFNLAAAAPVLFILGLVAFRGGARSRIKDIGRVSIGLGLMLLALHILIDTLAPAENAPGVRVVMTAITGDPMLCIIIAAAVTWAVHSSVAAILLVMSLAFAHFITPYAALALVLGANLGSAINPVFEGARRDNPASYRLPLGNLLNRLAGVLLVTPLLRPISETLQGWQPDPAKLTVEFHVAFNVATAMLFIGLLDGMARHACSAAYPVLDAAGELAALSARTATSQTSPPRSPRGRSRIRLSKAGRPVSQIPADRSPVQRLRPARLGLPDQHDVSDIDDVRQELPDDDDRLTLDDPIEQRQQAAPDREEPERHRHYALACTFARNPLHQEARGKHELRHEAKGQPEIEFADEHVVEIVAERLAELDQHHFTSVTTGVGFLRRISHHTPNRSMIPIQSLSKNP